MFTRWVGVLVVVAAVAGCSSGADDAAEQAGTVPPSTVSDDTVAEPVVPATDN